MTVVNPKSISGINSITMASGSDDLLTIHSNNTTERVRVNNSGDVIVGSGVTLSPDGDLFATGVTTSTTFVGNLTGNVTGTASGNAALTGSTNNTVTTVTGANAIQGESNLTFDGSDLTITNSGVSNKGIKLTATGSYYPSIVFDANRSGENQGIVWIDGKWNGTSVGAISVEAGDDTTNKDDGKITFYTSQGGTSTRKMAIEQDGNVHIDNGNLVIGTSGKGIDFSATSDASGSSSELLDDYEEGTFSVTINSGGTGVSFTHNKCSYTKIGRVVNFQMYIQMSGTANSDHLQFDGFPYNAVSYTNGYGGAYLAYQNNAFQNSGDTSIYFIQNTTRIAFYKSNGSIVAGNSGLIFARDFIIVGSYFAA